MAALVEKRQSRFWAVMTPRNIILGAVIVVLILMLVYPFLQTVKQSLAPGAFAEVFQTRGYRVVLWNTVEISLIATPVAVVTAFIVSHYMWNCGPRMRIVMVILLIIPWFTSILVKAFSWTVMLQDNGPINQLLMGLGIVDQPIHMLFTRFAVIIGMVHYMLPLSVVPIFVALMRIDKSLVKVSRSMGASKATTLFLVTIPMAKTGIVTSVVTTFVIAVGFYVTPAMLGSRKDQMVANLIDIAIKKMNRLDLASALSVIVFIGILVLLPLALQMLRPPKEAK